MFKCRAVLKTSVPEKLKTRVLSMNYSSRSDLIEVP
jgi:hypothetical protein